MRDRLFFFGGYQGTTIRQAPADSLTYVPTAAMMAGDFTAFASPACNGGRQITLRAPFVNNRVDPALFSRAALTLSKALPVTNDPCGELRFTLGGPGGERNEGQFVSKVDYQWNANHSIFGRYIATIHRQGIPVPDNHLAAQNQANVGVDNMAQSAAFGDTTVFGANMVNAFRVAYNRTRADRYNEPALGPYDLGIDAFSYEPHRMIVIVTGGFSFGTNAGFGVTNTNTYQISDDFTMVRGNHQLAFGASVASWDTFILTCSRCGGQWDFNGQVTGLGLADFMLGRLAILEHGGPGGADPSQFYLGLYGQDSWRATSRLTINAGLRWEPFFGQQMGHQGAFGTPIFNWDNFSRGVRSTQFVNAPPGFLYAGDSGFPPGQSGMYTQWWNLSPRAGAAWDVTGDGRMSVRASYGLAYDFPTGDKQFLQVSAPPFGNRLRLDFPPGGFDNPYGHVGGDPHPIVTSRDTVYPAGGAFGVMKPDIRSPRVQSWNLTLERQVGANWGVAVSYLGNYSDRLWDLVPINPAMFLGLGPCMLNGVVVSRVQYGREYERPPRDLAGESGSRAARQQPGRVRRLRQLDLPRTQALGAAPIRHRRQPERKLHAVTLLRPPDGRRHPPVCRRPDQPRRPRFRSRQLHAEQEPHRQHDDGVSHAAAGWPCPPRDRIGLADLWNPQCQLPAAGSR